jgi:hypothetical protein
MKQHHSPRGGRLMIGLLAGLCSFGSAFAAEDIPTGKLNVDRTLVRAGTRSQLDWQIQYPVVTNVVDVAPIVPKKDLKMRVRILGVSFQQIKMNNGHGNNTDGVDSSNTGNGGDDIDISGAYDDEKKAPNAKELPIEVVWSKNNSDWSRMFYGTQSTVDPTVLILNTTVKEGDVVNFGARGYRKGWLPLYNTATSSPNLVVLKNGDKVPSDLNAFQLGQIEPFLTPYLAADGKTVSIGNRDLIILIEIDKTSIKHAGFDAQDLVVLVTFE